MPHEGLISSTSEHQTTSIIIGAASQGKAFGVFWGAAEQFNMIIKSNTTLILPM